MKKYLQDYAFLALVAGVIIAIDQISKAYIRANFAFGEMWIPFAWFPYFRIVHWYNTGAAFGMLQGFGQVFKYLAGVIAIAIIYYFPRVPRNEHILRIALGLQLAGALGNLIDRILQGHVTDFISVGNFPVFNVADSSITVGVSILVLAILIQEQREKKAAALTAAESTAQPEVINGPGDDKSYPSEAAGADIPAAETPSENEQPS